LGNVLLRREEIETRFWVQRLGAPATLSIKAIYWPILTALEVSSKILLLLEQVRVLLPLEPHPMFKNFSPLVPLTTTVLAN